MLSNGTSLGEPAPQVVTTGWRCGDLGAEEADGAEIFERRRAGSRRAGSPRPVYSKTTSEPSGARNRPEEAGRGIADRFDLLRRDLEAVDVRDAGVIGAAIEVAAIRREHEALRASMCRGSKRGDRLAAFRRADPRCWNTCTDWSPLTSPTEADSSVPSGEMSRSNGTRPKSKVWIWFQLVVGRGHAHQASRSR